MSGWTEKQKIAWVHGAALRMKGFHDYPAAAQLACDLFDEVTAIVAAPVFELDAAARSLPQEGNQEK